MNDSFIVLYDSFVNSLFELEEHPKKIAIAVSGGVDSSTMSYIAKKATEKFNISMVLFHVNHGLQETADNWSRHVHSLANLLDVEIYEKKILVDSIKKKGIEGAARDARYKAFYDLSMEHGIHHVFLAHHQKDQAETLLFRLLRGSGVKGMAGMKKISKVNNIFYIRPWLDIDKNNIDIESKKFSLDNSWFPINDPTNKDPAYSRGVIRFFLEPVLDRYWPQWKKTLCRHASHMRDADNIIEVFSSNYLKTLDFDNDNFSFSLLKWRLILSKPIKMQVLRYWIMLHNINLPSNAVLNEIYKQLSQLHALGYDRCMTVHHDNHLILCKRGRVYIDK
ncbi:tRNA lysidine(34) synthetase TilS [Candidatus Kinetoplastidibacterium crithidiae]|uniref:tRNA(Ile)-lysidine synthase n=1 Tax=Candidatus Kinetoplastidibacterium crithidiae TCC036E TaxID=1208918 RepID=M1LTN1_9PROT|nr:tRNA lysidine(34) synthetase TilS [Candidatus Kinetoplastibacterium crithidii]AFZ83185.1 tRNA(Ile)-lysidine synthase [Candidatus Kinetoplastibacterium crithidii (ex Angomonas deanei ATCC 30255)]AGF47461.1 tRNA(Ile)-lysidine synthase MesJ [Candidatus Kinetoplastibacterium crithidii TCC036E]